jgi:alpha 1,3-mannosyltransferase
MQEEYNSDLMALDKSRLSILLEIVHAYWQNTKEVRDDWTYEIGYGDIRSWWFGLEFVSAEYSLESHYGSMIGDLNEDQSKV